MLTMTLTNARRWAGRKRAPLALAVVLLLALATTAGAQTPAVPAVEMADALRADGKIWVVAGVFAIVTLGILSYLFRLDRQLTQLEKRVDASKTKS